jgi:hypothetical protein
MLFLAIFCYFPLQNKEGGQENMLFIVGLSHIILCGGTAVTGQGGEI